MSFQSFDFAAFFALTLAVCLPLGKKNRRLGIFVLDAACAVFYLWNLGAHAAVGFAVLCAGTAVSWASGRQLLLSREGSHRRRLLWAAVGYHIAVLLVFKYTGFLTGGAVSIGWAPLGLSFFTFQQIWYLKELYTGQFRPDSTEGLALYAFFFPTISSGPILRPGAFFPQLSGERFLHPDWQDFGAGLYAVSFGMAKKVLLADSLGVVVNNGWAAVEKLTAPGAWLVILGYTLQLYFDFSGYCDIATGLARMLGLRLPLNFDSPYRALSVGEFWKRWHITLTTFLRECLYFPLGGSKKGAGRTYLNILLVFLISGFWHGAGWTFLLWGGLHGVAQIAERAWGSGRDRLPAVVRWLITFAFVNLAWVLFRAPDLTSAWTVLRAAVSGGMTLPDRSLIAGLMKSERGAAELLLPSLSIYLDRLVTAGLYGVSLLAVLLPGNTVRRMDTLRPTVWQCAAAGVLLTCSVLSFTGITTFIYANF